MGLITHFSLSIAFGVTFALLVVPVLSNTRALIVAAVIYGALLYIVDYQILGRLVFKLFDPSNPMGPDPTYAVFTHVVIFPLGLIPFFLTMVHRPGSTPAAPAAAGRVEEQSARRHQLLEAELEGKLLITLRLGVCVVRDCSRRLYGFISNRASLDSLNKKPGRRDSGAGDGPRAAAISGARPRLAPRWRSLPGRTNANGLGGPHIRPPIVTDRLNRRTFIQLKRALREEAVARIPCADDIEVASEAVS